MPDLTPSDGIQVGTEVAFDGVAEAIRKLPSALSERVIVRAMGKGARFFRDELKRAAPVRSDGRPKRRNRFSRQRWPGHLSRSIVSRKEPGELVWSIYPRQAFYGKFLEFGTVEIDESQHAWMGPAWDASRDEVSDLVMRALAKGLRTQLRKHGWK
jgi:HK97 gp10 family phage protein